MSENYMGSPNKMVSSEYLYNILKQMKELNDTTYGSGTGSEHTHSNLEVLEKISLDDNGNLLIDENPISVSAEVSDDDIALDDDVVNAINDAIYL